MFVVDLKTARRFNLMDDRTNAVFTAGMYLGYGVEALTNLCEHPSGFDARQVVLMAIDCGLEPEMRTIVDENN